MMALNSAQNLLAAAVGLGVTLLTALPSLWRATSGSPLEAMRPADVRPDPWWRRLTMVVVGAAVAAFLALSALAGVIALLEGGTEGPRARPPGGGEPGE